MVKSVMEVATKKIVLLALFGLLFGTMFFTNSAKAAVVFEIDNDSLTYGKYISGDWQHIYSSAYRYGDARLFSGNSSTAEYDWVINPGNYSSSGLNMDVYLNSSLFTNRSANYWYYNPNTGQHVKFKQGFDQMYANPGYGNTLYPPVPFFANRDNYIWVTPDSATSGSGTGADAVEFWY